MKFFSYQQNPNFLNKISSSCDSCYVLYLHAICTDPCSKRAVLFQPGFSLCAVWYCWAFFGLQKRPIDHSFLHHKCGWGPPNYRAMCGPFWFG